ncbi:MAG: peptidoglycan-associated lipoprotein, partial [Gammaproteobacteria bacterium]
GFGEELPLALGHNEAAYAENRRVELVYDANN